MYTQLGLKQLVIQIDVYIIKALVEPISYLSTGVIVKLLDGHGGTTPP